MISNQPIKQGQLTDWKPGHDITAEHLQEPVAVLRQFVNGAPGGFQAPRIPLLSSTAKAAVPVIYKSQTPETLICTIRYAGGAEGEEIEIAKPFPIRESTWAGKTINGVTYTKVTSTERTATNGTDTETQLVTPDYVVGQELRAVYVVDSNGEPASGVVGSSGVELDLEQDTAQEWALKFSE